MQVILLEKITHLGELGAVVKVKDGYARNFLIPQGHAKRATKAAIAEFEARRAELEKAQAERIAAAQDVASKLNGQTVVIKSKAGVDGRLFGSVTGEAIAEAIKQQLGYEVDKRKIELSEQIKQAGRFEMTLRLGPNITARMFAIVEAV